MIDPAKRATLVAAVDAVGLALAAVLADDVAPVPKPPPPPATAAKLVLDCWSVYDLKAWEAFTGQKATRVNVYADYGTIAAIGNSAGWIIRDHKQACVVEGRGLNLFVRMATNEWDAATNWWKNALPQCAAGLFDAAVAVLLGKLKSAGFTDVLVLYGHEPNGNWYSHRAFTWVGGALVDFSADYKAGFKRLAAIARSFGYRVGYAPAIGRKPPLSFLGMEPDPADFDEYDSHFYADNWGVDFDTAPNVADPANDKHWLFLRDGPEGLAAHKARADQLGKRFYLTEAAGGGFDYKVPSGALPKLANGYPSRPVPITADVKGGDNGVVTGNLVAWCRALGVPLVYWNKGLTVTGTGPVFGVTYNTDSSLTDRNSPKPAMTAAFLAGIA